MNEHMEITQEKTSITDERCTERFFEEVYSKADICYFLLGSNFKIISNNVTGAEKLGYDRKQFAGKKFLDLVSKIDQADFEKTLQRCLKKGYIKNVRSSLLDARGKSFDVEVNGLLDTQEEKGSDRIRLFIKDISDQIRFQRQRTLSVTVLNFLASQPDEEQAVRFFLKELWSSRLSTGLGIFLSDSEGYNLTLGTWGNLGIDSEDAFSEQQNWDDRKWELVLDAVRGISPDRWTDRGSYWIDSLSDLVLELDDFAEKESLLSLSDYESLVILPFKTVHYSGYLILTHTAYGRWDEDDIHYFESLVSAFQLLDSNNSGNKKVKIKSDHITLLKSLPFIGVLIVSKGKITFANSWILEYLGFKAEEMVKKSVSEFVESAYLEQLEEIQTGHPEKKESSHYWEISLINSDRAFKLTECLIQSLEKDADQVWFLQTKSESNEDRDESISTRKMETLGSLTEGVVHDFNNILSNLVGYSSVLSEEVPKDSPYYEDVQEIAKTSEKATELTNKLLAIAQDKSERVENLNLNSIITDVAGILSRTINKNIAVRADLDSKLFCIEADTTQVHQALLQVALNAKDAMPKGGTLLFQTRNMTLSENAARLHPGAKAGGHVQVIISDTGHGMSSSVKDQMFNAQFSTKNHSERGYGLTYVHEIVRKYNGFISVFSDMTKGTIFKLHFPATDKHISVVSKSNATMRSDYKTILLVEGEADMREHAENMLSTQGYQVLSVSDPGKAVSVYKRNLKKIDVVVLQMISPGVEIQKTLSWLKKLNPGVRIIASANEGEREFLDPRLRKHFSGFITKPFQSRTLLREIHSALHA